MLENAPPVFRFAPSPNGHLHLGHAFSALINQRMARAVGGKFLLRIEDIDLVRCTPELEEQMIEDLHWLGVQWDETPMRQSENFERYADALDSLRDAGLLYPSFMTRGEIKRVVLGKEHWLNDPDGSPHYPGNERGWSVEEYENALGKHARHIWRLDMAAALSHANGQMVWYESGSSADGLAAGDGTVQEVLAEPEAWGDVVLGRSDTPTSYHLSAVLDDAAQGITHIVRGRDLFFSTSVHRLLQTLLGLPVPSYHHHDLILDEDGRKLSKSAGDTSIRSLRQAGMTPNDIHRMVGL